jgi:hypothetical protein
VYVAPAVTYTAVSLYEVALTLCENNSPVDGTYESFVEETPRVLIVPVVSVVKEG